MTTKKVLIGVVIAVAVYLFYSWAYNRGLSAGVKATIGK